MILTIIFLLLMLGVVGKIIGLAFRCAWGILSIIGGCILFPIFLIAMLFCGLVVYAIPILIIVGIITLFIPTSTV